MRTQKTAVFFYLYLLLAIDHPSGIDRDVIGALFCSMAGGSLVDGPVCYVQHQATAGTVRSLSDLGQAT